MQNRSRYDSKSFLAVFDCLKNDELLPFLQKHSVDIDSFHDENLVCDIIIRVLSKLIKSMSRYIRYEDTDAENKKTTQENISIIAELTNLLRPQLSSFRNFASASSLLSNINNISEQEYKNIKIINPAYQHAKSVLADIMRLAITNGAELSLILKHIDMDNRVSFIDKQEKFWVERDIIKAREDAIKAEQQVKESAQEDARLSAVAPVNTSCYSPALFPRANIANDDHAVAEYSPSSLRRSI